MMRNDFVSLLSSVDVLELALETLQRRGEDGRVGDRFRSSAVNMFAINVEHFGKVLGRRLASCSSPMEEAGDPEFAEAFRNATIHGLISAETYEKWLEYRKVSREMASLDGKGFTQTVLGTFPRFIEDARELVEVMAGYRESEELELSDRFRHQVEQILEGG